MCCRPITQNRIRLIWFDSIIIFLCTDNSCRGRWKVLFSREQFNTNRVTGNCSRSWRANSQDMGWPSMHWFHWQFNRLWKEDCSLFTCSVWQNWSPPQRFWRRQPKKKVSYQSFAHRRNIHSISIPGVECCSQLFSLIWLWSGSNQKIWSSRQLVLFVHNQSGKR